MNESNEIPYLIDSFQKDEVYKVHIDNIYDPSKFWVILNTKERNVFQKYLTDFYKDGKIKMAQYHIKKYSTCMIHKGSKYYRALILPSLLQDNKLRVFLIDYGQTLNIAFEDVFYIFKKHCGVPRFAIRATLAYICPRDPNEPWSLTDLQTLLELISDQEIYGRIEEIDHTQKTLYLDLFVLKNTVSVSIKALMIKSGIGSFGELGQISNDTTRRYKRKVKYVHLIPTFNALEKGLVPCSLWEKNLLKDVQLDLLYKQYYIFQNVGTQHIQDLVQ